jgi:hypothetical protein
MGFAVHQNERDFAAFREQFTAFCEEILARQK